MTGTWWAITEIVRVRGFEDHTESKERRPILEDKEIKIINLVDTFIKRVRRVRDVSRSLKIGIKHDDSEWFSFLKQHWVFYESIEQEECISVS